MNFWQPGASTDILILRAELLHRIRDFFGQRSVLEVETPSLSKFPTVDLHLESFRLDADQDSNSRYLITSPEYHMKRLLSAGMGSIYQICKAFRHEEAGQHHNPEFTILEWYRLNWDHWRLITEVEALLDNLLGCGKADRVTYQEIFETILEIDPFSVTPKDFHDVCRARQITPPSDLKKRGTPVNEYLDFLLATFIEPKLGLDRPVFIVDYPATQAHLARIHPEKPQLAQRFEVYYSGIELGNGFFELADAKEQKERFIAENQRRKALGKSELPVDHRLLDALYSGLPDCSGVALGFDRIVMLASGKTHLDEIMSFSWDRC